MYDSRAVQAENSRPNNVWTVVMVWCRVAESSVAAPWSQTARGLLAFVALSAALVAPPPLSAVQRSTDPGPADADGPVVVYLVRHAEKVDDGTDDPPLALAGHLRVKLLTQLLANAELTHLHTTDWKRTRETVRPFAEELALDVAIYDPRELNALAAGIRATPGIHFVAGHSNTTPVLVEALGGKPFDPINDLEYDRLYVLVIHPGQPPVTALLRYGEPYVEGTDFGLRADRGYSLRR